MTNRDIDRLFTNYATYLRETLVTEATAEEVASYRKVEAILNGLDEREEDEFIDRVGDYAFALRGERATAYRRLYPTARRYGLTVRECEDWYFVEMAE